jgi:hypothetical protein
MLKKPCPYHNTAVSHTLEQCEMIKKHYRRLVAKEGDAKKDADGGDGVASGEFLALENVFFIVRGPTANTSTRQRRCERREVYTTRPATPSYLDWLTETISFGREDHPDYIPNPGHYPLVVDPVIGNTRFSKVLMDGGSSLNIMFSNTLELVGIGVDELRPSLSPFHGITPGKRVQPLWQIDLPVCFDTPGNFRKEIITFEVVGFQGAYRTILGRPAYAEFMAIPNYTYLKLKMPGSKGVITIGLSFEHAYECDVECIERVEAQAHLEV